MKRACLILSVLLASAPAEAAEPAVTYVHAGWLLANPDSGAVLRDKTIVIRDSRVAAIEDGFVGEGNVIDLSKAFVLPGLIDTHVHILSEIGRDEVAALATRTEAYYALAGAANARRTLEAGFTTVADKGAGEGGDAIYALRDAIADGTVDGPRILAAGRYITVAGGAHDVAGYRQDVGDVLRRGVAICAGEDSCRDAARREVRDGADLVKLMVTGGADMRTIGGKGQLMSDGEISGAVAAAHATGRRVAVHAHAADGINAALKLGADSIEHATYLDDESIRLFKKGGACLVPTLSAAAVSIDRMRKAGAPADRLQHIEAVYAAMSSATLRAYKAGIPIAFGSDSWVGPHGENAGEFALMIGAGISRSDAIRAATTVAARCLGISDQAGTVAIGRSADLVAVDKNPMIDIDTLRAPIMVIKGGKVSGKNASPVADKPVSSSRMETDSR